MTHLLFVYGTLARGAAGAPPGLAARLSMGATSLGAAHVQGRLVEVRGFKALVSGGPERVTGEILHVRDASLWGDLDAYKGVGEAGWYRRELLVAIDEAGAARSAWTYTLVPGRWPQGGAEAGAGVQEPRVMTLRERPVAVVEHHGPVETIDDTRRPLYRHMILNELVGGPSIVRFLPQPHGDRQVDALVLTHLGFDGDEVCRIETLPAGRYAVLDYEGPPSGLAEARGRLLAWAGRNGGAAGPVLQVHHMDAIDGVVEEQLQVLLGERSEDSGA